MRVFSAYGLILGISIFLTSCLGPDQGDPPKSLGNTPPIDKSSSVGMRLAVGTSHQMELSSGSKVLVSLKRGGELLVNPSGNQEALILTNLGEESSVVEFRIDGKFNTARVGDQEKPIEKGIVSWEVPGRSIGKQSTSLPNRTIGKVNDINEPSITVTFLSRGMETLVGVASTFMGIPKNKKQPPKPQGKVEPRPAERPIARQKAKKGNIVFEEETTDTRQERVREKKEQGQPPNNPKDLDNPKVGKNALQPKENKPNKPAADLRKVNPPPVRDENPINKASEVAQKYRLNVGCPEQQGEAELVIHYFSDKQTHSVSCPLGKTIVMDPPKDLKDEHRYSVKVGETVKSIRELGETEEETNNRAFLNYLSLKFSKGSPENSVVLELAAIKHSKKNVDENAEKKSADKDTKKDERTSEPPVQNRRDLVKCPVEGKTLDLAELNFENLAKFLQHNKNEGDQRIQNGYQFLDCLPKELFDFYVLMRKSRSSQAAPRVILANPETKLLMAFSVKGHPSLNEILDEKRPAAIPDLEVEFAQFHSNEAGDLPANRFEFRELIFDQTGFQMSERNPETCLSCHQSNSRSLEQEDPRPNWEQYHTWPGAYGGEFDHTFLKDFYFQAGLKNKMSFTEERRQLAKLQARPNLHFPLGDRAILNIRQQLDERAELLDLALDPDKAWPLNFLDFQKYTLNILAGGPNSSFTQFLANMNFKRIVRLMRSSKNWEQRKIGLIKILEGCGKTFEELTKRDYKTQEAFRNYAKEHFGYLPDWSMSAAFDSKETFATPTYWATNLLAEIALQDENIHIPVVPNKHLITKKIIGIIPDWSPAQAITFCKTGKLPAPPKSDKGNGIQLVDTGIQVKSETKISDQNNKTDQAKKERPTRLPQPVRSDNKMDDENKVYVTLFGRKGDRLEFFDSRRKLDEATLQLNEDGISPKHRIDEIESPGLRAYPKYLGKTIVEYRIRGIQKFNRLSDGKILELKKGFHYEVRMRPTTGNDQRGKFEFRIHNGGDTWARLNGVNSVIEMKALKGRKQVDVSINIQPLQLRLYMRNEGGPISWVKCNLEENTESCSYSPDKKSYYFQIAFQNIPKNTVIEIENMYLGKRIFRFEEAQKQSQKIEAFSPGVFVIRFFKTEDYLETYSFEMNVVGSDTYALSRLDQRGVSSGQRCEFNRTRRQDEVCIFGPAKQKFRFFKVQNQTGDSNPNIEYRKHNEAYFHPWHISGTKELAPGRYVLRVRKAIIDCPLSDSERVSYADLTYENVVRMVEKGKIKNAYQFVSCLPNNMFDLYTLMRKSESIQKPLRVILANPLTNLIMAFSTKDHPSAIELERSFEPVPSMRFEMIQFRDKPSYSLPEKRFDFYELEIGEDVLSYTDPKNPNPRNCLECHQSEERQGLQADPRPNWEPYDNWPGAHGEKNDYGLLSDIYYTDGKLTFSEEKRLLTYFSGEGSSYLSKEYNPARKSVSEQELKDRLELINRILDPEKPWLLTHIDLQKYKLGRPLSLYSHNNAITQFLSNLNFKRIVRMMKNHRNWKEKRVGLLKILARCGDFKYSYKGRVNGFKKYIAEHFDSLSDWSMSFLRIQNDTFRTPSQWTQNLISEIASQNPDLNIPFKGRYYYLNSEIVSYHPTWNSTQVDEFCKTGKIPPR